jgi:hypothetical protein
MDKSTCSFRGYLSSNNKPFASAFWCVSWRRTVAWVVDEIFKDEHSNLMAI